MGLKPSVATGDLELLILLFPTGTTDFWHHVWFYVILGIQPKLSCMLGMHSAQWAEFPACLEWSGLCFSQISSVFTWALSVLGLDPRHTLHLLIASPETSWLSHLPCDDFDIPLSFFPYFLLPALLPLLFSPKLQIEGNHCKLMLVLETGSSCVAQAALNYFMI